MNWKLIVSRDARHLWIMLFLVAGGGAGFLWIRGQMVPETFGQQGPYRAAALDEIAAKPSVLPADAVCLKCHADVGKERAEALHKAVRCFHCHGLGRDHVAQARKAAKSPDIAVAPAGKWDGNFLTPIDLYITKDKATCLVCHEARVGMPEKFKKIDVAAHLKEQEAEEPKSRETCFECHGGHDTAP
ncbi:MAG: hypothetical protein ACE5KM_01115 [Planctomycetaceae bacterium]